MNDSLIDSRENNLEEEPLQRSGVGRRGALLRMGAVAAGLLSGARGLFAQKRLAIGLDKAEKLKTVGGSALLKVQEKEILFVREAEDKVRALNPVCSHKKCTVAYDHGKKRIVCPCHGSNFGLDGGILNGPAEKPLQVFDAALDPEKGRIIFTME
jgi:Rieske Fe-S protein